MTIFRDYAKKYWLNGFSPIPIYPAAKNPCIEGWQKFCEERADETLIDEWCQRFPGGNIGLCMGQYGIAVDVDLNLGNDEHAEIFQKFSDLIPYSAAEKFGSKGFTRIFQNETPEQTKMLWNFPDGGKIELLALGQQTVVPPSIHPEMGGAAYRSLGVANFWMLPYARLPSLPDNFIDKFEERYVQLGFRGQQFKADRLISGRNDYLKGIVFAMLSRHCDREEILSEILKENLSVGDLFGDEKEPQMRRHSREENADRFITSIEKSFNRIEKRNEARVIEIAESLPPEPEPVKFELPLPESGFIKDVYDYIAHNAISYNHNWAICSALAMLGSAAANKFKLNDSYSNNLFFFIGPSSSGKTIHANVVRSLVAKSMVDGILGCDEFKSDVAMLKYLQRQTSWLMIVDEASWLLSAGKNSQSGYARVKTIFSELWSRPGSEYRGRFGAIDKKKEAEEIVWSPCINAIMLTTDANFEKGIESEDVFQGFLNRCFVIKYNGESFKRVQSKPDRNLTEMIFPAMSHLKRLIIPSTLLVANKEAREVAPENEDVRNFFHTRLDDVRTFSNMQPTEILRIFTAKFPEHFNKLVMLSALSRSAFQMALVPTIWPVYCDSDVEWAFKFLMNYFEGCAKSVPDGLSENKHDGNLKKVENELRSAKKITKSALYRALRRYPAQYLNSMIDQLEGMGRVGKVEKKKHSGPGRPDVTYLWLG